MVRKITLALLACLALSFGATAQSSSNTDDVTGRLIASDTATYNPLIREMIRKWTAWNTPPTSSTSSMARTVVSAPGAKRVIYQIPIVVHIIHTGGATGTMYNPTDAQVDTMIAKLNRVYATQFSAFPDTTSGGTYMPFQFVLAQRDPSCGSTTGITRDNGNSVAGYTNGGISISGGSCVTCANEVSVKDINRWPVDQYMNIWVVNKIDSTDGYSATASYVAGYAYLPPGNPGNVDGVVMLAQQVSVTPYTITLPHELGHTLGLYHVFQGGTATSCPPTSPCLTTGDFICDTEPIKNSNFTCPTGNNPCTGTSYNNTQHNIMDYSSCQDRFTPGQRSMTLFSLFTYRPHFVGALGGTPTSIAVSSLSSCTPSIVTTGNNYGPNEVKITDLSDSTFGAINTYLDYTSDGYTGDGNIAFMDLTCKQGTTLISGNTYLFSIKTGNGTSEKIRVYIDFNNNGTFDATELVMSKDASSRHETDTAHITLPTVTSRPSLVTCTPLRMRVISDQTSGTISPCGPVATGQAEDYMVILQGGGPTSGSLSISLPPGSNPSCTGTKLVFKATTGAGIGSATFKWFVNGTFNGVTTDSFVTTTLPDGSIVTAKVYYPGACGSDSAISNIIVVTRSSSLAPTLSISLTVGNNPGCPGRSTTFTAYPTSGGTSPAYQWKVNGFNVGTSSPTYTSTLNAGDLVSCVLTSSATCATPKTATSNTITIFHYQLVADVRITADSFPACQGKPVIFKTTTANAGSGYSFEWFVNGVMVPGATGATYVTSTLNTGDVVNCVLLAPDSCVLNHTDTSNSITADIQLPSTPSATVTITKGNNPGCLDSLIEFTAAATNVGTGAIYQWYVNGVPAFVGTVFSTSTLKNGDIVALKVIITSQGCYTADTALPAPINMVLSPTPPAPVISLIGNMLVSNIPGTLRWFGPAPSGEIAGESSQSYHPTAQGNYYARIVNNGCSSEPSNILGITLLDIESYDMSQVKVYPNPTSGQLVLDWNGKVANVKIDVYNSTGKKLAHDVMVNQSRKTMDLSFLPNGTYFVVLTNSDGKVGTLPVILKK